MKVRILGAHNIESAETGFTSILIDDVLAIDAGSLTSGLTVTEQKKLKAVLLTHPHYDHIRDIPAMGMNFFLMEKTIDVYTPAPVREALLTHLVNGKLYPDFTKFPEEKPTFRFHPVEAGKIENIEGYEVLPAAVQHTVPAVGYQVTSPDGKKVFISSDTGPGLADTWQQISPDLLIIELTLPNKEVGFAHRAGHLTPSLLQQELESFLKIKNYLPQTVLIHLNPLIEKEIKSELRALEKALNTKITCSYEGMIIKL
jgi:ribonuclease BN (tRNA processing enzyme)